MKLAKAPQAEKIWCSFVILYSMGVLYLLEVLLSILIFLGQNHTQQTDIDRQGRTQRGGVFGGGCRPPQEVLRGVQPPLAKPLPTPLATNQTKIPYL